MGRESPRDLTLVGIPRDAVGVPAGLCSHSNGHMEKAVSRLIQVVSGIPFFVDE